MISETIAYAAYIWDVAVAYRRVIGAFLYLLITLYLIYGGIWFLLTGVISLFKTFQTWLREDEAATKVPAQAEPWRRGDVLAQLL